MLAAFEHVLLNARFLAAPRVWCAVTVSATMAVVPLLLSVPFVDPCIIAAGCATATCTKLCSCCCSMCGWVTYNTAGVECGALCTAAQMLMVSLCFYCCCCCCCCYWLCIAGVSLRMATDVEQLWISMISANIWCCCACCWSCQVSLLVLQTYQHAAAQVCQASCAWSAVTYSVVKQACLAAIAMALSRLSGLKRFSETFTSLHLQGLFGARSCSVLSRLVLRGKSVVVFKATRRSSLNEGPTCPAESTHDSSAIYR
jgi:hypothetical protein